MEIHGKFDEKKKDHSEKNGSTGLDRPGLRGFKESPRGRAMKLKPSLLPFSSGSRLSVS